MVTIRADINEDPVMDFTMCLLNSVTSAHILHLKSTSFSQHMALRTFYSEIGDLIDGFVEAFQGKYGLLTSYPDIADLYPDKDPIAYLEYLRVEVETLRRKPKFPQDSELQNEVDNIANLINSTLYKLRFQLRFLK